MTWLQRHRTEVTAFVASLCVHAVLLAIVGAPMRGQPVLRDAMGFDSPRRSVVISIVALEASQERVSRDSLSSEAVPARSTALIGVESTNQLPLTIARASQTAVVTPDPKVAGPRPATVEGTRSVSTDLDEWQPGQEPSQARDDLEETARALALRLARAVNAAHVRERNLNRDSRGEPAE